MVFMWTMKHCINVLDKVPYKFIIHSYVFIYDSFILIKLIKLFFSFWKYGDFIEDQLSRFSFDYKLYKLANEYTYHDFTDHTD